MGIEPDLTRMPHRSRRSPASANQTWLLRDLARCSHREAKIDGAAQLAKGPLTSPPPAGIPSPLRFVVRHDHRFDRSLPARVGGGFSEKILLRVGSLWIVDSQTPEAARATRLNMVKR